MYVTYADLIQFLIFIVAPVVFFQGGMLPVKRTTKNNNFSPSADNRLAVFLCCL
jgi:hypothetical protein